MTDRRLRIVAGVVAGLVIGLAVLGRTSPVGPAIGIATIVALGLLFARHVGRSDKALAGILVAALTARLAVIAIDTWLGLFPKVDATSYHLDAATLAEAWWHGQAWQHMDSFNTAVYEAIIAPLYFWFGSSPLLARTFNVVVSVLATYNVFRIGQTVFDRRAGLVGAGAFALLPSLVRVHGEHLREAVVILAITQALYVLVARRLDNPAAALSFGASMVLLALLRRPSFVVLLAPIALALVQDAFSRSRTTGRGGVLSKVPLTALIGAGLVLAGGAAWTLFQGGDLLFLSWLSPEHLTDIRDDWATGGSGYLTDVTFDSWWDVITFVPVGALYFLLTPLPWQVHNPLALVALAENVLLFYPLVLLALPAMAQGMRRSDGRVLLVLLLVAASLYGLIEGNVGTVIRHRAQFTWVIFVFAGKTLADLWGERASRPTGEQEGVSRTPEGSPSAPS